ncbi:uncharacterized protein sh2d7 [Salminus brasiliensis]|uniref:uncharacterized protein sh2d7 n=1 Tax=Salminus brasiliensis TaxID=930266 RepID=UPI003B83565C
MKLLKDRDIVRMEDIHAAMEVMMSRTARLRECVDRTEGRGKEQFERTEGGLKELVLRWFVETQASLILCDGNFPTWFHGFISRQEAEDHLRDKSLGCFLIRLSEKASGYILSYKGQDRCRHFVINQTRDGMLVVTGDSITHNSLPELIEFFRITPIQPFGECLISEKAVEAPSDDVYDVVHCKPSVKSGVSVQALRSLWDQRGDITPKGAPALPPKNNNRKLISSASIDRNNSVQKNLPLRNSLSGGHLSHCSEQHAQSDQRWRSKMRTDEGLQRSGTHAWDNDGFSSLDSHLQSYSWLLKHGGDLSTYDGQTNSHHSNQSRSLPHLDEDNCPSSHPSFPASPHQPLVPPKLASFSSSSHFIKEEYQSRPDVNLTTLHPNLLYQTSSGLCSGHNSLWGPHNNSQPSNLAEISSKPINDSVSPDSTYQHLLKHQSSNTYEDLATIQQDNLAARENNTYEDLPEIQEGNLLIQDNTYEDIPATHNNTYATMDELQPTQSTHGKKTHKWWKFKSETKKK